jgi:hypothetical protein
MTLDLIGFKEGIIRLLLNLGRNTMDSIHFLARDGCNGKDQYQSDENNRKIAQNFIFRHKNLIPHSLQNFKGERKRSKKQSLLILILSALNKKTKNS